MKTKRATLFTVSVTISDNKKTM